MGCTSIKPGHTTRPDRGTFKKARLLAKGRIAGLQNVPLLRCNWRELRQAAIAAAHQRLATAHQPPHAGTQGAVLVPVGRDGIRAEQPFGHFTQDAPARVASSACKCVAPAPRPAWAGNGPQPQARPRSRRTAHPAGRQRTVACARRGTGTGGVEIGHAVFQARRECEPQAAAGPVRHQHQTLAIMDQLLRPGTRQNSKASASGGGSASGSSAPRHHDRGTRPGARRAHPERDLPASAGPKPAPRPASDDGAASRGGSRVSAQVFLPARGRSGVGRRDRPLSDTSVRRCDQSWRDLPVLGVRRHGFRRAGAIETPSGRHQKG